MDKEEQGHWDHVLMVTKLTYEIERLQEALRSIASNTCCDKCQEAALVARVALKDDK